MLQFEKKASPRQKLVRLACLPIGFSKYFFSLWPGEKGKWPFLPPLPLRSPEDEAQSELTAWPANAENLSSQDSFWSRDGEPEFPDGQGHHIIAQPSVVQSEAA